VIDEADCSRHVGEPTGSTAELLLLRSADGDVDAFARFYDMVSPRLYQLLCATSKDPSGCEQILHDAMLEIWRTCPTYDGTSSAEQWAIAVTIRRRGMTGMDRASERVYPGRSTDVDGPAAR